MQGFNMGRYRPPEALDSALAADGRAQSLQKRNPGVGSRGNKSHLGITTVRFEMPFAIWCNTCLSTSSSQLIGQGVRFNAEKKKVGNYFSSPIWSFRMKHAACGGWIEIRTDPKNSEYEVTDGARKRDTGDDAVVAERTGASLIGPNEKAREDAFAALEGKKEDTVRAKSEAARLEELKSIKSRDWKDPDALNRKLRKGFRAGRKTREQEAEKTADLQEKLSLGVDLLPESDRDRQKAQLIHFGEVQDDNDENLDLTSSLARKSLFEMPSHSKSHKPQSKLHSLQSQLSGNTRAKSDPFSQTREDLFTSKPKISNKKRKLAKSKLDCETPLSTRPDTIAEQQHNNDAFNTLENAASKHKPAIASLLVDYDSE